MKISVRIHHNRRLRLKKDGTAPIEVEAYFSKKRIYLNLGIFVAPKHWSNTQCKVIKKDDASHLNKMISNFLARIEKYEAMCVDEDTTISLPDLKEYLFQKVDKVDSLVKFARAEVDGSTLELASIKRNKSVINTFEILFGDLAIASFDYAKILEYNKLLKTDRHLSNNTIIGHHKTINKFLNVALKKDIIQSNPYANYKIGTFTSTREALTVEEVQKLEELKVPITEQVLQQVKDMFLFCCFTGVRFSDMQALTVSELIETEKGLRLRYTMQKVDRANEIPLYSLFDGKPEAIAKKYICTTNDKVFPTITNQAMNRNLKTLALSIAASVKLTSHIARHTFGTMLADLTQNPYLIMQLMGHSDIKTSMIYIHLSQKRLENQLDQVKWF